MAHKQLTRAEELRRDIALHEATLADKSNIKSGFHEDNVKASLANARRKLEEIENG